MITTDTIAARAHVDDAASSARAYIHAMGALADDEQLTDVQVIEMSGALMLAAMAKMTLLFGEAEAALDRAEAEHDAAA